MQINQDFLISSVIAMLCIGLFIAAFPLKNWHDIKKNDQKKEIWDQWLSERPNKLDYCRLHNQDVEKKIGCDYCEETRQMPSLEMVIPSQIKFGMISNTRTKYLHYKTYVCPRCSSELYREKYEA